MALSPPPVTVVRPDNHLGPVVSDGRGQVASQLDPVDDQSVGVIEELDHGDTHRGRGGHLLRGAQRTGLAGRHGIDTGLAPGGQHVTDILAHGGPAGYGRRRAVFKVVGMGHHRQSPAPILWQPCPEQDPSQGAPA